MTDALLVVLEDSVAGTVTRLRGGRLRFDYREEYVERPGATPLSMSMPLQVRSHADRVVAPWLWGLLPDNDAVLRRWARQFHVSASSPFSLLATPVGEDCAGAVRFAPAEDAERILGRAGEVAWLPEEDVAQRLCDLRQDTTAWLGRSFTGQFSLAGAQAKTALLFEGGRWGVPSGSTPTTHILKPAVVGLDAVWRFADALIWNWLLAGTDAHAKNYSLLLAGGQARLAPLYDIASALPYGAYERSLRFAMKLGGDYRVFTHRNTWPTAARELRLEAEALYGRVRELARAAPDAIADAAHAPEIAALGRELPHRLLDLVADRADRCTRLLDEASLAPRPKV
ncbi:MAG: HipA N-terminal domain-containing protein [Solirubrobacteraceae bacterium]